MMNVIFITLDSLNTEDLKYRSVHHKPYKPKRTIHPIWVKQKDNVKQSIIKTYQALQHKSQTQPELSTHTGLSLPAIIQAIKLLEQKKLICEDGIIQGQGRPAKHYRISPEQHTVLSIDLGGSSIKAGLFDLYGKHLEQIETISLYKFSKLSRQDALNHLQEISQNYPQAKRIGICTPGIVTPNASLENSWIFGLQPLEKKTLETTFQKPVELENDARSAAWGEFRQGQGTNHFAFVTFAYGIGAGIVLGGQLLRGSKGAAGELSYLPPSLAGFEKPRLGALAYGFFESLRAVSPDPTIPNWESEVFHAAQKGSANAKQAVQEAVEHIALAIAGLITTLDPDRIVLRQEFPHTQNLVLEPLSIMLKSIGLTTPLLLSALGRDAGLIGIALLAAERLEQELLLEA
jgi:predicted NBD/HSP70 family sugar kinase